jgi:hypothetical protein
MSYDTRFSSAARICFTGLASVQCIILLHCHADPAYIPGMPFRTYPGTSGGSRGVGHEISKLIGADFENMLIYSWFFPDVRAGAEAASGSASDAICHW